MTWIRDVPTNSAEGPLRETYGRIAAARGRVSNLWQVCGLDPRGLGALFAHYQSLMDDPSPLSPAQAEMIAVAVSATNGCDYCVAHHGPRLAQALGDVPLARAVVRDYREANLTARDRVLLDAAVALSCEPSERKREDIERLREYGFDDASILKTIELSAFYNQINRIVSSLGVELESGLEVWEYGSPR